MASRMPRRRGPGVLTVIAGLLVISGGVRLAGDIRPALAAEAETEEPMMAQALDCPEPVAPEALLRDIRAREAAVAQQETMIADRMEALRLAESRITEQLDALSAAEASLADTLTLASTAAENDIGRLTLVYENMPPQEVAALFEEMDPQFSSGFLARMAPEAAAEVMTFLTPTTAYSISVVIAGRNANAPTD